MIAIEKEQAATALREAAAACVASSTAIEAVAASRASSVDTGFERHKHRSEKKRKVAKAVKNAARETLNGALAYNALTLELKG